MMHISMLAFHWLRKILRIWLDFCQTAEKFTTLSTKKSETARAACFPLTSQHSSVQSNEFAGVVGHLRNTSNSCQNMSTDVKCDAVTYALDVSAKK